MTRRFGVALLTVALLAGCDRASPVQPSAPVIGRVQPSAASIGQTVTLVGSGFTADGNTVEIGDGYVAKRLTALDSSSLQFVLPDYLVSCPPDAAPCLAVIFPLSPGSHKVWVTNANGTSNAATLQITSR